jgi:uncharacterized protein (DUF1501 family)
MAAHPAAAFSAPSPKSVQTPSIITVYLRGGADALSAVVPFSDKDYPRHRPTLAMAAPGSSSDAVLPLDDRFGFNPRLKELHALYQAGMCVPIVAVGSPHSTRSHFDAQDFMERGAPGMKHITTGWLNRYLQETRTSKDPSLRAVSLQPLLPRSLRGDYPVLARPDQKAEQAMAVYGQMYTNQMSRPGVASAKSASQRTKESLEDFGARTIEQLSDLNQVLEQSSRSSVNYPQGRFARQMRDLATLIKARRGFEVSAIDYGGWDHHIDEGPLNGQMSRQLTDVSAGIGAFVQDLGQELMSNVLVLVMSEFGRTVKENNNRGTDHGHGGFMLAIGGKVNPKAVYGKWTGLADNQLYDRRDLPVHTDFRIVFAEALRDTFGFDGQKLGLFPSYSADAPPLDFLQHA